MATPFYGTLTIQNNDGTITADRFDSTDVTTARVTWTSAGGGLEFTSPKSGRIKDICLNIAAAGTTKSIKLWLNNADSGIHFIQEVCGSDISNRFPSITPIPIRAGTKIQMEVIT